MATIAQTQKYYANRRMSQLRAVLAGKYGPKKYRMTNAEHLKGWMFVGYVSDLMHQHCI